MASGYPLTFPRLNLSLKEKKNQCNLLARGHIASADGGFISPLLSCVCSKTPSELSKLFFHGAVWKEVGCTLNSNYSQLRL